MKGVKRAPLAGLLRARLRKDGRQVLLQAVAIAVSGLALSFFLCLLVELGKVAIEFSGGKQIGI